MAKGINPTSVGEQSYSGERAFQQLLLDIRANKTDATINIESIDSKNAQRLLSAIAGQQRTYGANASVKTLNVQEGRIGGDFFRMLNEISKGSKPLEVNLPGHTPSAQDGLYMKDIQRRNPSMKVAFGDQAPGFDSAVVTTFKPNDFTRSTSFEFASPKTQFAKVAPEPRVAPFGPPRSYAQPANVSFVDPDRKGVQLGRVYDSQWGAKYSDTPDFRSNARALVESDRRTNWTNGTSVGLNYQTRAQQFNKMSNVDSKTLVATSIERSVPYSPRSAPLNKNFNNEAVVAPIVDRVVSSVSLKEGPKEWSRSTLSHLKYHMTHTIDALPHIEGKLKINAEKDYLGAVDAMYVLKDKGFDAAKAHLKTHPVQDRGYIDILNKLSKDLKANPAGEGSEAKADELVKQGLANLGSRYEDWGKSIDKNVTTQYSKYLAEKLISRPQAEWASIIPAGFDKDRLTAVKEAVVELAQTNRKEAGNVLDRVSSLAQSRPQDYSAIGKIEKKEGGKDKDSNDKNYSDRDSQRAGYVSNHRVRSAFDKAQGEFTREVNTIFAREYNIKGDRDSIVDLQRQTVMGLIPRDKSELMTAERMTSKIDRAREVMDINLERFENETESLFSSLIDKAPLPSLRATEIVPEDSLASRARVTPTLAV